MAACRQTGKSFAESGSKGEGLMGCGAVLDLVLSGMWFNMFVQNSLGRRPSLPCVLSCYKHCPLGTVTCYPEPKICGGCTEESVGVHQP